MWKAACHAVVRRRRVPSGDLSGWCGRDLAACRPRSMTAGMGTVRDHVLPPAPSPDFDEDPEQDRRQEGLKQKEAHQDLRVGPVHLLPAVIMQWETEAV